MGGAEQLQLFDSPVSGLVLATHQGAQQECNRPDQLRQCRDHCYSDLGFLLPVKASPPSRLTMVFSHCPVTSSQRNRSPAGIQVSRGGAVEAALSSHWAQSFPVEAGGRAIETYACKGHSANNDGDCYWTTPIDAVREHEGRGIVSGVETSLLLMTGVSMRAYSSECRAARC